MHKFYLSIFILAFVIQSCQPITEVCEEEKDASAIIYTFPDSIYAGVGYDLSVHYIIENSCGTFLAFDDSVYDNTTEVKVRLNYEGCNCNLNFVEDSMNYTLFQDTAGYYNYKFYVGNTDFDSYILKVVD